MTDGQKDIKLHPGNKNNGELASIRVAIQDHAERIREVEKWTATQTGEHIPDRVKTLEDIVKKIQTRLAVVVGIAAILGTLLGPSIREGISSLIQQ